MAVIKRDGHYRLMTFTNEDVTHQVQELKYQLEDLEKGSFRTFMERTVLQQWASASTGFSTLNFQTDLYSRCDASMVGLHNVGCWLGQLRVGEHRDALATLATG